MSSIHNESEIWLVRSLNVNRCALTSAMVLASVHLSWALLVAVGYAQPLVDLILWLHFIKPTFVVEAFEPSRAVLLVIGTGSIGYGMGALFATIWNYAEPGLANSKLHEFGGSEESGQ